jgi:hypothetical protein
MKYMRLNEKNVPSSDRSDSEHKKLMMKQAA